MYATLQKNLKLQKEFSKQIKDTANSVKNLAKQKLAPIIKVKDQATKVINKIKTGLKTVGKTVAKPFIWLKDKIGAPLGKIRDGLKAVGKFVAKPAVWLKDKATAGLSKLKNMLGSLAKGVSIAVGVAGGAIVGGAISEGAKLQQSKGGIETLYKGKEGDGGVVDTVMANANKAYKTAGLSANAYMETVTSFSASLLSSLGGDTKKASEIADRAIIDMADNANKFGTDMSSIQTTYAGFAKQNYTMLDNLKLGYGGTKEEMARLIKEASAMKSAQQALGVTVDANSMSFDNIINAISVVQKNLGVTGATANEASTTFTGSFNAMKASAQNLLGNLAVGGDVTGSMEALVDSAMTFLVNNAIPMLGNIFTSLPKAISTGIKKVAPQLKTVGGDLITSVKEGIIGMLPSSMQGVATNLFGSLGKVFNSVTGMLSSVAPKIAEKFGSVFGDGGGILDGITSAIEMAMPTIENLLVGIADIVAPLLGTLGDLFKSVFPAILSVIDAVIPPIVSAFKTIFDVVGMILPDLSRIFTEVGQKISEIIGNVVMPIIQSLQGIFEKVFPTIMDIISVAWDLISPIIDLCMEIFQILWDVLDPILNGIADLFVWVWDKIEPIVGWLADAIGVVADAVSGIGDFIGGGIDAIGNFFGFAYGKDRVPYDNYPAILHQGEKVLTRNQADQYERLMSTRGVQVNQTGYKPQPTTGGGGNSIHIEKLADTVIIEKEADVDKVVEGMVTKFKKLVPNMP